MRTRFLNVGRYSFLFHPASFSLGVHYARGLPWEPRVWALLFDLGPFGFWIRFGESRADNEARGVDIRETK